MSTKSNAPNSLSTRSAGLRGSVIKEARTWIQTVYGDELYSRALSRVSADDRAALAGTILAGSWYPVDAWTRVLAEVAVEVQLKTARSQSDFYLQLVRESGGKTVKTVYKFLLELFSPQSVVSRIPMLFNRLYSEGTFEVVENETGRAVVRYRDASPVFRENIRQMLHTSIIALLEMNGVKDIQTSILRDDVSRGKLEYEVAVRYRAG